MRLTQTRTGFEGAMYGHRVSAKWIGAARNKGFRARLFDIFVDGRRVTDEPVRTREIAMMIRESLWAMHPSLERTARGDYRGMTCDGHKLFIKRRSIPAHVRRVTGLRARTVWTPMIDGVTGDFFYSAYAAAAYLTDWWAELRAARKAA